MWLPFGSIDLIFEPIELKQTLNNQQIVFLNAGNTLKLKYKVLTYIATGLVFKLI